MSAPLTMLDRGCALAPVPDFVLEAAVSAVRQHEAGQIFDVEHISLSKINTELEVIHPEGVLTWTVMFTVHTTSGIFFWCARTSARASDSLQPGELSDVKLSVYDPNCEKWTHVLTYKHPFSSDHTMWLSDLNTPFMG